MAYQWPGMALTVSAALARPATSARRPIGEGTAIRARPGPSCEPDRVSDEVMVSSAWPTSPRSGFCGLFVSGVRAVTIVPVHKLAARTRCSPWLGGNDTGSSSNGRNHKDGKQLQFVRHVVFSAFADEKVAETKQVKAMIRDSRRPSRRVERLIAPLGAAAPGKRASARPSVQFCLSPAAVASSGAPVGSQRACWSTVRSADHAGKLRIAGCARSCPTEARDFIATPQHCKRNWRTAKTRSCAAGLGRAHETSKRAGLTSPSDARACQAPHINRARGAGAPRRSRNR